MCQRQTINTIKPRWPAAMKTLAFCRWLHSEYFLVDKRGSGKTNTKWDVYEKQGNSEKLPMFLRLRSTFFFLFQHSSKETELLLQVMNPDYFSTFWGADKGEGWCNDAQSRMRRWRRWKGRGRRGGDWKVSDWVCRDFFLFLVFLPLENNGKCCTGVWSLQLPPF